MVLDFDHKQKLIVRLTGSGLAARITYGGTLVGCSKPEPIVGALRQLMETPEERRRRDQIDFETQQMLREAESSRVRAKQVVRDDLRRTPTVPSNAGEDASTKEDAEHTANLRTMITQVDACVRLSKGNSLDANDCIDRLKLTDPAFARTWAQSGHIVRLPTVSATAKP